MSVLIEGISVVIRRETLAEKYPGGPTAYIEDAPNSTVCADAFLTRVGFMDPDDVETFVTNLEDGGLVFVQDGSFVDIAVVDQINGPTNPVSWMDCSKLTSGDISITIAFDKRDTAVNNVIMPVGWIYENSLSHKPTFIASDQIGKRMQFLREEDGVEIYRDLLTGKEQRVGRTIPQWKRGK